jgi:hypothetical protein
MFCCGGLFGILVYCLCLMDEMLIRFSLVFDRCMTTPSAIEGTPEQRVYPSKFFTLGLCSLVCEEERSIIEAIC